MQNWVYGLIFFVFFAVLALFIGGGYSLLLGQRKRKLAEMIQRQDTQSVFEDTNILEEIEQRGPSGLSGIPIYGTIQRKIQLAALTIKPELIMGLMVVGAVVGGILGSRVEAPILHQAAILGAACLGALLPYGFVAYKASSRMDAFEEVFPEALDFLARSMRAGHAFSISLEMMAEETPDPVGSEFRWIFHEQNLGASLETTLRNFAVRIPLLDAKLFVSAVLLQRETGGNLAEILTKLSFIIRERFRLKGQVKAASAHGRITAVVLSAMPVVTLAILHSVAPDYFDLMMKDPAGRWVVLAAITLQLIGYLWMKKIINIKV